MAKKFSRNLTVAVDLGGTNLRVAVVSRKGKILKKVEALTIRKGKNGKVITGQIIRLVEEIRTDFGLKNFLGIGVSGAGPQDRKRGAIANAPNMAFNYIPIVEPLWIKFKIPVYLLNDGNAGALGEKYFGLGKKIENLVYITMSSGIGGGAIVNGNLLLGKDGSAAEIGHMVVDTEYNMPCSCRKGRGHWEAYASGNNIPKFLQAWVEREKIRKIKFGYSSAEDIFEAARKKDKIALEFMKELGKINGRGISNVVAAYDPEVIVFGGAVALNNFDLIIRYAKPNIDKFLKIPKIVKSPLGENAPLLGAGSYVLSYPHRNP